MSGMASRSRLDQLEILLARVAPAHRRQHARRAGLHRQVQVPADLRQVAHRGDHPRRDVPRVRAREADPLEPLDARCSRSSSAAKSQDGSSGAW